MSTLLVLLHVLILVLCTRCQTHEDNIVYPTVMDRRGTIIKISKNGTRIITTSQNVSHTRNLTNNINLTSQNLTQNTNQTIQDNTNNTTGRLASVKDSSTKGRGQTRSGGHLSPDRPNYLTGKFLVKKVKVKKRNNKSEENSEHVIRDNKHNEKTNHLRTILAPRPRHMKGPVLTYVEGEEHVEEAEDLEVFSCPEPTDTRQWGTYPDPKSCKHYYICMGDTPPMRHGCNEAFNNKTGTCDSVENVKECKGNRETFKNRETLKNKKEESKNNVSLFMEFTQFLIKQGFFNKKIFLFLLQNKNSFL